MIVFDDFCCETWFAMIIDYFSARRHSAGVLLTSTCAGASALRRLMRLAVASAAVTFTAAATVAIAI